MTHSAYRTLGAALAVLLAGCASTGSQVRVDRADALPNCHTFAWHAIQGDTQSLTDQRVQAAVKAELQSKGYELADTAECKVAYRLTTHELPKAKPGVGVGVGGGSRGVGGGIGVSLPIGRKAAFTGAFTLDVIDAAKNAQVWSGTLDSEFASAELSEREVIELVREVLSAYPDRQRAVE